MRLPFCRYCMKEMPFRLTRYGLIHGTQPKACCDAHRKRLAEWDKWIRDGQNVRLKVKALPPMPKEEAVAMFRL